MRRISIKMIAIIILLGAINFIRIIPRIYKLDMLPCTLDGIVIYSKSGMGMLLIPLIITFFNLNEFKYDFKGYNIVRRKQKMDVWYTQMVYVYIQCLIVTVLLTACAGVIFYDSTGTLTYFEGEKSIFANEFLEAGQEQPESVNVVPMVVLLVILNSGELYVRVLLAVLVYWLTETSLISVISSVAAGLILPGRCTLFQQRKGIDWPPYYTEIYDMGRLLQSILFILAAIICIWLVAGYFIPRKDFLKE